MQIDKVNKFFKSLIKYEKVCPLKTKKAGIFIRETKIKEAYTS